MAAPKKPFSRWDRDPIRCPWGHLRTECERSRPEPSGRTSRICAIHRRENQRANEKKRVRKSRAKTDKAVNKDLPPVDWTPIPIPKSERKGTWIVVGDIGIAHLRLTCNLDHVVTLTKETLDPYGVVYCPKCEDYSYIHEISARRKSDHSRKIYQLREVPPLSGSKQLSGEYPPVSAATIERNNMNRGHSRLPHNTRGGEQLTWW